MDKILLGKPVAQFINERTKSQISQINIKPTMSLIQIGFDPASSYYIKNIIKQGNLLGCEIQLHQMPITTSTSDLVSLIKQLNDNTEIHGIMIQKPLPVHIDENLVNNAVNEYKDIDGINPTNIGKIFLEQTSFVPCTAAAVIELAKYYGIDFEGKQVVVIGRSNVVGKPLMGLLLQKSAYGNATVTVCHSKTKDIQSIIIRADVVIAAIGKPLFVKAEMIKQGSVCIDVGINQISDEHSKDIYVGDIDYNECLDKTLAITPVPGGIGTITTAILMSNLAKAAILQYSVEKKLT